MKNKLNEKRFGSEKFDYLVEFIRTNSLLKRIIDCSFFIFWFILTHITKLYGDDLRYQLIIGTDKRVSSIKDIFISQYNHFFMWGGRSVAHFLNQLFLMYDKLFFDIFNAIIFCLTCNLIYSMRKQKERNNFLLILVYISFWFFSGDLCRGTIWQTGSFNYLWMLFSSLLFIKIYYLSFDSEFTYRINGIKSILFYILSFLAGWGHEIISPVALFAILIYLVWKCYNKIQIQKFEIIGFVMYLIGTIFLVISPGNFARLGVVATYLNNYSHNIFIKYIIAFFRNGYFFILNEFALFLVSILVVLLSYYLINKNLKKVLIQRGLFYFIVLFFSVFFYFFMFGWSTSNVMVQLIILDLIIVRFWHNVRIPQINKILFIITFFVFIFFIIQFSVSFYYVLKDGRQIYHEIQLVR